MTNFAVFHDVLYALIVTTPRIAGIFIGMHYTNNSMIPRIVKTGIIFSFALIVLPLNYNITTQYMQNSNILVSSMIGIKEVGVGIIIGIIFNMPFHIFILSGALMDAFKGSQPPYNGSFISGGEGTPTSTLLGYLSLIIIFSSGYFNEFIKYSLLIFKTWPIHLMFPKYSINDVGLMLNMLNILFIKAVFVISPIVMISILIDLGTLVLAKQLPQVNPTMLVMPIKAIVISAFLILLINKLVFSDFFDFETYVFHFESIIK